MIAHRTWRMGSDIELVVRSEEPGVAAIPPEVAREAVGVVARVGVYAPVGVGGCELSAQSAPFGVPIRHHEQRALVVNPHCAREREHRADRIGVARIAVGAAEVLARSSCS